MTTVGSYNYQTAKEKTVTTTGNIDDLDLEGAGLLRMNNASLATIRGFASGYAGQEVTVVSIGAGQVDLAHQNAGSVAGNRLRNVATSGNTSLAAGSGQATYKYDEETARWRLVTHDQGAYITPAFDAGNFTTDVGTWTVQAGDVFSYAYKLSGVSLHVILSIQVTTVATAPTQLRTAVPGGFTPAVSVLAVGEVLDNGIAALALLDISSALNNYIRAYKLGGAAFAAATDNTYVIGSISFPVT